MKRKPNATPNTTTFTATEPMGVCKFCDLKIAKGRRVMSSFDGTGEFVHVRCWVNVFRINVICAVRYS